MARRAMAPMMMFGLTSLALLVGLSLPFESAAASKTSRQLKKPLRNPKFDPSAEQVDVFEAMGSGQVTVRLVPKDAMGGTLLIENKTDKPLTVKIPDAVVGISIHAQINNLGQGLFNNGIGLNNGNGNMAGGTQAQGGGVNQQANGFPQGQNVLGNPFNNGNGNNGNMPGNGFFSIPAEKAISLDFRSVCLEHGKADPDSSCRYTIVPVSKVSQNPVLYQLLVAVGQGKIDAQAAQAATWHLTDKMSFDDLANKMITPLGGQAPSPYFTSEQLEIARDLVTQATERAQKAGPTEKLEVKSEPRASAKSGSQLATN